MLTDHRVQQEQWTRRRRERAQLARAFGYFIANLAAWDWFLTITLGDRHLPEERSARGEFRRDANLVIGPPDPRLANYQPSSRWSAPSGAPAPGVALKLIERFLAHLQDMAAAPIGWMIAEEFGWLGGRWHCHGLITGVSRLYRKQCWQEARRHFGYTRIEPFDSTRGAAFYAAKYAGRAEGTIHFGGTLAGSISPTGSGALPRVVGETLLFLEPLPFLRDFCNIPTFSCIVRPGTFLTE